jgi:hypothetical protein
VSYQVGAKGIKEKEIIDAVVGRKIKTLEAITAGGDLDEKIGLCWQRRLRGEMLAQAHIEKGNGGKLCFMYQEAS